MSKGQALLVGLRRVDSNSYDGWTGENGCWGCEKDVDNIANILSPIGYQVSTLKTSQATAQNILDSLKATISKLEMGDIFVFYFSGHGGQQPDLNGDELDGKDETLIAFDRPIVDDELNLIWSKIKLGVRVLMLSDSCNSGTNFRGQGLFEAQTPFIPIVMDTIKEGMMAQMIHLGGCLDGFSSAGCQDGGAFTTALCKSWQNGAFVGNYNDFYEMICQKILGSSQKPQYNEYGPVSREFRGQHPFTIESSDAFPSVPNAWVIGTNKVSGGYGIFKLTSSGWQPWLTDKTWIINP